MKLGPHATLLRLLSCSFALKLCFFCSPAQKPKFCPPDIALLLMLLLPLLTTWSGMPCTHPCSASQGSMGWWGMVCAQHTVACVCMGWARVARAWVRELSHEGQNLGFQFHIVLALSIWLLPYYYYPYVIPHSYFVALSLAFFLLLFCLCYRTFNYLVKLGTQVTLLLLLSHSYSFDLLLFCSCSFALLHLITWVKPGTHASWV